MRRDDRWSQREHHSSHRLACVSVVQKVWDHETVANVGVGLTVELKWGGSAWQRRVQHMDRRMAERWIEQAHMSELGQVAGSWRSQMMRGG